MKNATTTTDSPTMSRGELWLFGVNHKTAPIELREQLAIPESRLAEATRSLVEMPGVREAMILSTCNRVEVVIYPEAGTPDLMGFFNEVFAVDQTEVRPHVYEYR